MNDSNLSKTSTAGQGCRPRPSTAPAGVLASLRETSAAVRWLLCCVFVNQLGAFVQVFLVLYLVHAGIDGGRAGLALGGYGLGAVLGGFVGGALADRFGRRTTIAGAMICAGTLTVALSVVATPATYGALVAVVIATGMAAQASRPAAAAMLADLVAADRLVMTVSMSRLALNCGAVLAPLLAAPLIAVSWNLLFWVDGLTAGACALLAWRFLPGGRPSAGEGAGAGERDGATDGRRSRGGYGVLLGDRRFLLYLFAMFAAALIYIQYFAVLPLKIRADGHAELVYSGVLAMSAGLVVCCELGITTRVSRWRPWVAASGGVAMLAVGLAAYAWSPALWLLFPATVVGVLGQIVSGPTMFAHPSRIAPPALRGRYAGAALAMFGLGTAVGPLVGLIAWKALGDGIWTLCGAVGGLATLATLLAVHEPSPAPAGARISSTPITGTVK